jgi:environmental stress-induced protein Ves
VSLQLVSVAGVAAQPWRNGGGTTRELWAWPDAAAWQVRISVADITQDGPFSAFPGVDRWFAVVEGAGVVLQFPAGAQVAGPHSPPLQFDGALAPGCCLQDGATRDLNLMSRRQAGRSTMRRLRTGEDTMSGQAMFCALFAAEPLQLELQGSASALPPWTLAVGTLSPGHAWRARCGSPLPRAWWLTFRPGQGA